MRTVVTFGVWDLLHVGHVRFLERARGLGDFLVVGVPMDAVVKEDKGQVPIVPTDQRVAMLWALRCVDHVKVYGMLDFLPVLEDFRPTELAVGQDWGGEPRHLEAMRWCKENGCRVTRLLRTEGVSTSGLVERIRSRT